MDAVPHPHPEEPISEDVMYTVEKLTGSWMLDKDGNWDEPGRAGQVLGQYVNAIEAMKKLEELQEEYPMNWNRFGIYKGDVWLC